MDIRNIVLGGAGFVGLATAATSSVSLYSLAIHCGIPDVAFLPAALPIALDVGAAVAALVWISEDGELRKWGRGIALAALAGTLIGNGIEHAIATGFLTVSLPLVIAVGATIPAMLFGVIHLVAMMAKPVPETLPDPVEPLDSVSEPETLVGVAIGEEATYAPVRLTLTGNGELSNSEPISFSAPPAIGEIVGYTVSDEVDKRTQAVQWAKDNWPVTGKEIAEKFDYAEATAYRIRREADPSRAK